MNLKKELETEIFKRVAAVSNNMNINTFVVGGYVRDLLLNRPLKNDIDFVSESDAIILAQKVAENINSNLKVTIFKRFGTAMIRHNNIDIEFVSARKESYVTNSRKPTVEKGSLEDDQNRRDFTINALAISLQTNNFGDLI
ncbi:MAG: tRNA nucleotidyltransferase, partial [Solirubrobacteraceae bacterium]